MTQHNYPTEYMVHGISSETLRGNENTIYSPVWFVESDGSYFWTFQKSWTQDDLREIIEEDTDFIYFLKEPERVSLREGESVYLAGSDFMTNIRYLIDSGDVKVSMNAWEPISNGYYIAAMTSAAFSAFIERLCLELWEIVEKFLTDRNAELKGTALKAFDTYNAISFYSAEDKRELSLRKAMVYLYTEDADLLKIESYLSVEFDKFFDTTKVFHSAAKQRLDALQQ
jgi:hypothetical protein